MSQHRPTIDVRVEQRDGGAVAYLTVDNAAKLNVLDSPLMESFIGSLAELHRREDLRALVVRGAGERAFVGGASIDEMATLDHARSREFIERLHQTCDALRRLPVPVIARIDGHALGAGLELAASCDLRVASSRAVLGMPEVKLGLPSVIEAALLPGLIGWGRTRQLLLLGEPIGADEALRWGLVQRVVAPAQLDGAVEEWVRSILAAGPHAVRLQKSLIQEWEELAIPDAVEAGVRSFSRAWLTGEPATLLRDFLERRRAGRE